MPAPHRLFLPASSLVAEGACQSFYPRHLQLGIGHVVAMDFIPIE